MSKWDKLIFKISTLSKELRFSELRKVLESYGYVMNYPKEEAVTILLGRKDVCLSQYLNMNQ